MNLSLTTIGFVFLAIFTIVYLKGKVIGNNRIFSEIHLKWVILEGKKGYIISGLFLSAIIIISTVPLSWYFSYLFATSIVNNDTGAMILGGLFVAVIATMIIFKSIKPHPFFTAIAFAASITTISGGAMMFESTVAKNNFQQKLIDITEKRIEHNTEEQMRHERRGAEARKKGYGRTGWAAEERARQKEQQIDRDFNFLQSMMAKTFYGHDALYEKIASYTGIDKQNVILIKNIFLAAMIDFSFIPAFTFFLIAFFVLRWYKNNKAMIEKEIKARDTASLSEVMKYKPDENLSTKFVSSVDKKAKNITKAIKEIPSKMPKKEPVRKDINLGNKGGGLPKEFMKRESQNPDNLFDGLKKKL